MSEYTLWPANFDSSISRSQGRELSVDDAVESPTAREVANAVKQIGYDVSLDSSASYPREPMDSRGKVVVTAEDSKTDIMYAVAAYLEVLRE